MTMKRILSYLTIPALLVAAASCAPKEEIEFAHEAQAFETRSDRILVEAILPQATAEGDEVYIIGDFNGNDAAVGNAAYRLTRSTAIPSKWGVYVDPSAFQGGKTLADGFTFYNVQQGLERGPKNEDVLHKLTIGPGEWANVYADKWAKYFAPPENPDEIKLPELDGFGLFVDASEAPSYAAMALYAWGTGLSDADDLFGGWPGMQPTGTWECKGVTYVYFDLGSKTNGLTVNFIINNNNGGSQLENFPALQGQVIDHNFFFKITDSDVIALDGPGGGGGVTPQPEPEAEDGPKIYIKNSTTWGGNLFAHYWGTSSTEWPGKQFEEKVTVGEDEFLVIPTLHKDIASEVGIIFHSDVDDETNRYETKLTLDTDRYYELTNDGLTELDMGMRLWVKNESRWPGNLFAHIWAPAEEGLATEWPGIAAVPGYADGKTYDVILVPNDFKGKDVEVIFHDDADADNNRFQAPMNLSQDEFYVLSIQYVLDPEEKAPVTVYVIDQTGWDDIALYMWGDVNNLGGGWPGIQVSRTETVGKTTLKVFEVPNALTRNENLIFNNNNNGSQLGDFNLTFEQSEYYLLVTAEGVEITERPQAAVPKVTVFVDDQTGWDALALYQWGDVNDLGGGWPGAQVSCTVNIAGTDYKVFVFEDAVGLSQNLIFNNNNNGQQLGDYALKLDEPQYFLTVTAEGVTPKEAPNAAVIFANDQTGWDALALYQWGDVNNLGGDWPGAQVSTTATVGGKDCKVFVVEGAAGLSQNLIFNNNNGGLQLGDYAVKFEKVPYFLKVTADGVDEF